MARRAELETLSRARAGADQGAGQLVVVLGEPGGGKTRLVEEFLAERRGQRARVGWGRASEEAVPAYWPWRQAFRALDLPFVLPDLGTSGSAPAGERLEIAEVAITALGRSSEGGLVIVVLDDLQWADDGSLHLLRQVTADVGRMPVLVVATGRDSAPDSPFQQTIGSVVGRQSVTVLRLSPFRLQDVADYLGRSCDDPLPAWVHSQSGGNPLYVRELSRLVGDQPVPAGPWSPPLPGEIRALIGRRLSQLDPRSRRLVEAASVLGDDVELDLLQAVHGHASRDLVDAAVQHGVLRWDPDIPGRVQFSHGLVRSTLYAGLPSGRRVELHREVANVLEREGGAAGDDRVVELALHRLRAASGPEDRRRAVELLRLAAASAGRRLAFDEAARLLHLAMVTADLGPLDVAERAELGLELARARFSAGQVNQAIEQCQQVIGLAETAGRPDLAARAALVVSGVGATEFLPRLLALKERALTVAGDEVGSALRTRLQAQVAAVRAELGLMREAEPASRAALEEAERLGDVDALVEAVRARQVVCSGPEGVVERLALGTRLVELQGLAQDEAVMWGRLWRIDGALQLGNMEEVRAQVLELTAVVERLGLPMARWHLLLVQACLATTAGQLEQAERLTLDARRLGERLEDYTAVGITFAITAELERLRGREGEMRTRLPYAERVPHPVVKASLAAVLWELGDEDGGGRFYEQVKPAMPTLVADGRWLPTMCSMARMASLVGDTDGAARFYEALFPYAAYCEVGGAGAVLCRGSVASVLGRLAATLGRASDAARHYAAGATVDRRMGALPYLAETLLWWAELDARSDTAEARRLAGEALTIATRLGMEPTRAAAAAVLESVVPATRSEPLTRREQQVATLVAAGRSNREIAEEFVLSERTVESHVSRILGKLGLTSRTQLAAWVLRNR